MTNKLIGYQIVSRYNVSEMPECFQSFEVIDDASVAEKWLLMEKNNPEHGEFRWVILPVFEGEVENPTFIDYI